MIIRVARRRRFTVIDQRAVNDGRLSFRARGILAWLLDKPDDWQCNSKTLTQAGREGRDAVLAALRELEVAGYLRRDRAHDERGRWLSTTTVYEQPVDNQSTGDGFPGPGSPGVGEPGASSKTETKDYEPTTPLHAQHGVTRDDAEPVENFQTETEA